MCQALTWENMWQLLIISNCVIAPFMKAQLHLPIRNNQPPSQSCPTVCGVSSLCQWTVLLPDDYRCDLSHLCTSMRQLSTFLIQTIIAWFSNVLKCKCSELWGYKSFSGLLAMSVMGSQQEQCYHYRQSIWLNPEYAQLAIDFSHLNHLKYWHAKSVLGIWPSGRDEKHCEI